MNIGYNTDIKVGDSSSGVSFKEKLSYGLGDSATAFALVTITNFIMYYYTDVIGVAAGILGTVFFIARMFDGVTDIAMGYVIDRTRSKYGKARPWILWMMIPHGLSLILLFFVPSSWGDTAIAVFILITYNIYFLIYTAINVPFGALGALVTQNSHERTQLNVSRMICYFIAMIIISNATIPMAKLLGNGSSGWKTIAVVYAVISVGLFAITFFFTSERVESAQNMNIQNKVPLGTGLKSLLTNKYWLTITPTLIFAWILLGLLTSVPVYYADQILNNSSWVGLLTSLLLAPLLIGFLIMPYVTKKLGRRNTIIFGLGLVIVGSLVMAIGPSNLVIISLGSIVRGIGFAPIMGNAYAMLADTIEYGEWKQGIRIEGLVYSGGSLATKLGSGAASGGIGWVLGLAGYISGGKANQPDAVFFAVKALFIYIPIVISLILIGGLCLYNLDKIYPKIMSDLRERANKN